MRDRGKHPKPEVGDIGWSIEHGVFTVYVVDEDADSVLVTNYWEHVVEIPLPAFEGNWSEKGDGSWQLPD